MPSVADAHPLTWVERCPLESVLQMESTVKLKFIRVKCAIQQHYLMHVSLKSGGSRGDECRVVAHRRG